MKGRMMALVALMVSMDGVNAQAAVVGRISGHFTVSPTGASNYQIPISLPPGPHGMQPNLSLLYNSQSGVGMLGPGWRIAGLSSITRCKETFDKMLYQRQSRLITAIDSASTDKGCD